MRSHNRQYRFFFEWVAVAVLMAVLPSQVLAFSATAQVDRTRIGMDDTVRLQVVVEGGDAEVDTAPVTDFQILSSGTQSSRSYINGNWKHEVTYLYQLAPQKTGVLKIPPLRVADGDEAVFTEEIQILCEAVSRDDTGKDSSSLPRFEARAELDTATAVPGQQVIYTLRLFSPESFAGAQFNPPAFKGLDARELTKWKKYTRTENGLVMVVNEIKFLIQAPGPGTYEIDPAIFTVQEAVRRDSRRGADPFDNFFNDPFFNRVQTRPVRVASNHLSLTVRPLPPNTEGLPFSGLVGEFTMAASLDKEQVAAGESVTLTIVAQGRGNIMDIGTLAPRLAEDLFKVYPDAPTEELTPTDQGLAGTKTFRLALVPKVPGTAEIPPVTLTFFSPSEDRYKTIATTPLPLEVLPGKEVPAGTAPAAPAAPSSGAGIGSPSPKTEVRMKNRDILDIREDISAISPHSRIPMPWFLFWLALPGAGFLVLRLLLGHRQRQPDQKAVARKKAEELIRKAQHSGPSDPGFLPALQSGLTYLILARAGRYGENLTSAEARDLLAGAGVDPGEADKMIGMMETLDQARFGGKPMDDAGAGQCLKQIRTWARTLMIVAALTLSLNMAPSVARASEPATRFVDAVREYNAGQYEQAARNFEAIAAEGIENSDLYYNAGNAWLRTGDLGRAVLWYERALRLAPSDPDVRFNLAHARSLVKDRIDRPFSVQDILFFWKGVVSLKTLQIAAIAASALFFLWAGVQVWQRKKVLTSAGVGLLGILMLVAAAALLEEARLGSDTRAVILAPKVAVRSGTQKTATALFDLHRGAAVNVLEKKGNYIKIGLAGDKVGWVSLADAEII